jgi:hypothetical protein
MEQALQSRFGSGALHIVTPGERQGRHPSRDGGNGECGEQKLFRGARHGEVLPGCAIV